jgi:hypothetical protein
MKRLILLSAVLLLSACRSSTDAPTVTLSPLSPTTVDDLVAGVDSCDNCKYRWFKNNVAQGDITGDTVSANLTTKGESWSLLVTSQLDDGTEGPPGEAEATIENSPPVFGEYNIRPNEEVYTNDILTATVDATDADGEEISLSYSWMVDGVDVGVNADTLDGLEYFDKGQEVYLTVTASDGESETQESTEVFVVLNTAPGSAGIELDLGSCTSLEFNGTSSVEVNASETLEYGDAFTFEGWFRWDNINTGFSDFEHLFSQGWDSNSSEIVARLALDHSGAACGQSGMDLRLTWGSAGNSNCLAMQGLTANTWQHVAVVYDEGEMRGFIDGVLQNSVVVSAEPYFGRDTTLSLGAVDYEQNAEPVKGFGGAIRDFRVSSVPRYSSNFTADESLESDSDTLLLLPLDEGTGSFLQDGSGNGNHGSTNGTEWSTECAEGQEDGLHCRVVSPSEDLDGDEITYTFAWDVDGTDFLDTETTEYEGDTVPDKALEEEDVWTCLVTPDDGDATGDTGSATYRVPSDEECEEGSVNLGEDGYLRVTDWSDYLDSSYSDLTLELFVKSNAAVGPFCYLVKNGSNDVWAESRDFFDNHFDTWVHFAIVFDSVEQELRSYVDGELKRTDPHSSESIKSGGLELGHANAGHRCDGVELQGLHMTDGVVYSGSSFTPPTDLEVRSDTLLYFPLTESNTLYWGDRGPFGMTMKSGGSVGVGSLGPICEPKPEPSNVGIYSSCTIVNQGLRIFEVCGKAAVRWENANDACLDNGYDGLASLHSSDEASAVKPYIAGHSWIGLNDIVTENSFEWVDGTTFDSSYAPWGTDQPDDTDGGAASADCVVFNPDETWQDATCRAGNMNGFICSWTR